MPPPTIIVTTPDELREIVRAAVAEELKAHQPQAPVVHAPQEIETGPRLLRIHAVRQRVSVSERSIWNRIKDGTFPPPLRHEGNAAVWKSTTIDLFVERGYPFPTE